MIGVIKYGERVAVDGFFWPLAFAPSRVCMIPDCPGKGVKLGRPVGTAPERADYIRKRKDILRRLNSISRDKTKFGAVDEFDSI